MLLAGLDIGTTGCKVTVYSPNGVLLGRVYRDYTHFRSDSEHEADPVLLWQAVQEVLAEAANKWPKIGALGVSSFGESFVLLDERDEALGKIMLYTDPRGKDECEALCAAIGREKLAHITGVNPHSMYSISKLMWVKKHQPAIWARVKRVCLMEDYVVYLLSGQTQISYALASRTMAFDIQKLCWSDIIFKAANIDSALLAKPVATGTAAGNIKPFLAAELGIGNDTLIVSAGHDQLAAAVGSGVFDEGVAVDGAGTVQCITPVFTGIPQTDIMAQSSYAVVPYVLAGKYVCYAFSFTGGAAVDWFVKNLAGGAKSKSDQQGISIYTQLEGSKLMDKPTGLLVLPHFAGAATPYMDTGSKAAIIGLTLANTQTDLYLAIMEGVCFEMRLNMERLKEAGVIFNSLRATGGGANSRVWLQMKADILNVPITALATTEASSAGAAMMAGVAKGVWPNLLAASSEMVVEDETFSPRAELVRQYDKLYSRYEKLYDAVRPLI